MKILLFTFFLLFQNQDYSFKYENEEFKILYSYERSENKNYIIGLIEHNETGEKAVNTNILVEGHQIGTVTKLDGTFKIETPDKKGKLIVHKVGYQKILIEYSVN